MLPRASTRWMGYGAVLALAVVAIRVDDQPDGRVATPAARAPSGSSGVGAAARPPEVRTPELDFGRLAQRARRETEREHFSFRSWEVEEAGRSVPPPPLQPPQAPPLPFAYLGKLIEAERVTVFLTNGNRNWVVRAGDNIDGVYRVDAIGERTMTVTYLALDIRQEFGIGAAPGELQPIAGTSVSEALPVAVSPRSRARLPSEVPLLLAAPSRVAPGDELILRIGLPPGGVARNARIELVYDPKVLAAVGAPGGGAGRVSIALAGAAGPPAQVRFRVVAQSATSTQIEIESATATDARGAGVPIATPDAHGVAIVQARSAN